MRDVYCIVWSLCGMWRVMRLWLVSGTCHVVHVQCVVCLVCFASVAYVWREVCACGLCGVWCMCGVRGIVCVICVVWCVLRIV